jgi:hypothetical protein
MRTVNRVLKIKAAEEKELRKAIFTKLASEKISKKLLYQLITELDFHFNSIYDNYDSEPEETLVKLESVVKEEVRPKGKVGAETLVKIERDFFDREEGLRIFDRSLRRPMSSLYRDYLFEGLKTRKAL